MKTYTLTGANGKLYESTKPGKPGGYKRKKIYRQLDCPGALRSIAKGEYLTHRVFFADESTAIEAG